MGGKVTDFNAALSRQNPEADDDWAIRLSFLFHDVARLRRIVMDEKFKPLKITRSQAWLLAYLSRNEGVPQSALAEKMGLGKVALGGLIDRLQIAGVIERRADSVDRRVNNVFVTAKGKRIIGQIRNITLEANEEILKGLSADDIRRTAQVMAKIKDNLQMSQGIEAAS